MAIASVFVTWNLAWPTKRFEFWFDSVYVIILVKWKRVESVWIRPHIRLPLSRR